MSHQDECDTDKLTGLEDFGLLLRPLGLTEKKLVPDPITFTEPDPLGALVYRSADPMRTVAPKGIMSFGLETVSKFCCWMHAIDTLTNSFQYILFRIVKL